VIGWSGRTGDDWAERPCDPGKPCCGCSAIFGEGRGRSKDGSAAYVCDKVGVSTPQGGALETDDLATSDGRSRARVDSDWKNPVNGREIDSQALAMYLLKTISEAVATYS
jgi:hypothetical protein